MATAQLPAKGVSLGNRLRSKRLATETLHALAQANGDRREAARLLGISYAGLVDRIKRARALGFEVKRLRKASQSTDPSPDEIEELCSALRARHFDMMRNRTGKVSRPEDEPGAIRVIKMSELAL